MKLNHSPAQVLFVAISIHLLPLISLAAEGDTWRRRADMPTRRIGLSTCVLDGKIYAIGGYLEAGASGIKAVEAYDPVTDTWTRKADMLTARAMPACATVNGRIYAIGGAPSFASTPFNVVEEYDPTTDKWSRKAAMPTPRSALGAVEFDGKIYVMGGLTTFGTPPLSTVEVYDPVTDTWQRKASMRTGRSLMQVSVVEGKIFAIGSSSPGGPWLPTVEMYDPVADIWTRRANMPTARGGSAGGAAYGKIYVMGGRDSDSSFATVEEYDPLSNQWTRRANMWVSNPAIPTRRWVFSASELNGRIYTIGWAVNVELPHSGLSLVVEYTPPVTSPLLQPRLMQMAEQNVLRLEWPSRTDCLDVLQSQDLFQTNGWSDVQTFSGTGGTLIKDIPAGSPTAFYRLQRELR